MSATTRDLIRPNPSKKVQYILAIFVCILLFFTVRASFGQSLAPDTDLTPAVDKWSESVELHFGHEEGPILLK